MKKLILLLALLLSLVAGAQGTVTDQISEKTQFKVAYSQVYTSSDNKWRKMDVVVLYNYNNNEALIKVYIGSTAKMLTQMKSTVRKVDADGDEFFELEMQDEQEQKIILQFYGQLGGLKMIFVDSSFAVLLE